jgi:hypothetical protein
VFVTIERYTYNIYFKKLENNYFCRFVAVYFPIKYMQMSVKRKRIGSFLVLIFSTIYCIPRFLEHRISVNSDGAYITVQTDLRENPIYLAYYRTYGRLISLMVLPLASLCILNLLIFLKVNFKISIFKIVLFVLFR